MRKKHPEKPIMICELGRTSGDSQAKWVRNAFSQIKSWPGIKGVVYWHSAGKNRLTPESCNELSKIFQDEYYIGVDWHPKV